MSRYAISDPHGCHLTLIALLERIGYTIDDELFLLGDYIDRGPGSKEVINEIWRLQREGHMVRCLRGNHEQMALDSYTGEREHQRWIRNGGDTTLASFGGQIGEPYLQWMRDLPYYLETPGYLFVHAGLNFRAENPLTDLDNMLWIRLWYRHIDYQWLGDRTIVHGHTVQSRQSIEDMLTHLNERRVIDIDAGCVFRRDTHGQLCAFDLDRQELHFQPRVERRSTE